MVDLENGLWRTINTVLAAHHLSFSREQTLEQYAVLEAEASVYRPYRTILKTVLPGFGVRLGFTPTTDQRHRFSDSFGDWPWFEDSAAALRSLQSKYKLAIVSNVDDDLFAGTVEQPGIRFDWVVTAW